MIQLALTLLLPVGFWVKISLRAAVLNILKIHYHTWESNGKNNTLTSFLPFQTNRFKDMVIQKNPGGQIDLHPPGRIRINTKPFHMNTYLIT